MAASRRKRWLLLWFVALTWEVAFQVAGPRKAGEVYKAHPGMRIRHTDGSYLSGSSLACLALFATGGLVSQRLRCSIRHGHAKDAVQEALGADFFQLLSRAKDSTLRPLIVAMGTRGDAEPGFRLAAALRERGHVPLVVSLDAYKNEAERLGLDFCSCGLDKVPLSEEYLTGRTRADQVYSDRGWYGEAWTMVGDRIYAAAMQHGCDVIVTTSMANTHCLDVAEKLDLLCFALKFCPDIDGQVPVGAFPPSGYPSLPGPVNYLQHVLENLRTVAAVFQGGYIPKVIEFRKNLGMESLEIPMVGAKVPTYSEMRQRLQANQPSFYAFSNSLTDRPSEYQPWHFITGSFSGPSETSELPGPLETFLKDAGAICVAFGSITLARGSADSFQDKAIAAARRCGKKVLVVDPQTEGPEGPDKEDSEVFRIRSAPYSALFPRCSLVVHHGGAGTAQDCILAETAQLIAPVLSWSDQPFWANEVENRMLGLKIGEGGTPPSAAAWDLVFQRSLEKLQTFQRAAVKAKKEMAKESGLETACQILEDVFSS